MVFLLLFSSCENVCICNFVLVLLQNFQCFFLLPCFFLVNSPPRIIKQPPTDELLFKVAQQNKESDKPFIIECEAEGNPDPT